MPKTTYEKTSQKAIRVNQRALTDLWLLALPTNQKNSPSFKVKLSDGATIDELNLKELLELPNSITRAFKQVQLSNRFDSEPRIRIWIGPDLGSSTITYSVTGQDKEASYIHGEIEKILRDCYEPYSYFFSMPQNHSTMWLVFSQGVGVFLSFAASPIKSSVLAILGPILVISPLVWGFILSPYLMPPVVFDIGDGISRAEQLKARRSQLLWVVIIGTIIAIVTGLIVAFLYDQIK